MAARCAIGYRLQWIAGGPSCRPVLCCFAVRCYALLCVRQFSFISRWPVNYVCYCVVYGLAMPQGVWPRWPLTDPGHVYMHWALCYILCVSHGVCGQYTRHIFDFTDSSDYWQPLATLNKSTHPATAATRWQLQCADLLARLKQTSLTKTVPKSAGGLATDAQTHPAKHNNIY